MYVLARFQTVPGGLVANGVRVPRSLHGFYQGVVSSGEGAFSSDKDNWSVLWL